MQHNRDMFSFGEEKTLKEVDLAIDNIKNKLGLGKNIDIPEERSFDGNSSEKSLARQRVLTNNSVPSYKPATNNEEFSLNNSYYNFYSDSSSVTNGINNNSASSFVLVVAAIISLIAIVSVVTFGILNIINY